MRRPGRPAIRAPYASSRDVLATAIRDSAMTNARRFSLLTTATAVAIAMGGCASSGNDPATTPTPTSSSSTPTTATSTTTPPSKSEIASTAAAALVTKYYATVDRLGQQPKASLDQLSTVATGV